jgi:3-methyladenine DNA glycosylase AlkD
VDAKEAANKTRDILKNYDPAAPAATADALREVWRAAAPELAPDLVPGGQPFVRDWGIRQSDYEAVGTPVPVLRAMGQEIGRVARKRVGEFLPLARLLWERYGREGRVVTTVFLGPMELADPERVVPVILDMARTCEFWEDCDQLAMRALEPVLRREPGAWLDRFGEWVQDENKWLRRAALTALGRLPMVESEYTARCVELVSPALGDADTDVKRALSFAVRLCARGETEPVKQFIRDHADCTDADSLWVLSDVIRSLWAALLPEFVDLLPIYQAWLETGEPKARRSVEGAIRVLERAR